MTESLGHFVPFGNKSMSSDRARTAAETAVMSKKPSKSAFKQAFIERVKLARKTRGYTQAEIAVLLGVDQSTYKQYETRTYLPHDLMPLFCIACNIDPSWLVTGTGRMNSAPAAPRDNATKTTARNRGKAA